MQLSFVLLSPDTSTHGVVRPVSTGRRRISREPSPAQPPTDRRRRADAVRSQPVKMASITKEELRAEIAGKFGIPDSDYF